MTEERGQPERSDLDRKKTARHEAAHALVAVRLDLPLIRVHIVRRQVPGKKGLWVDGETSLRPNGRDTWDKMVFDPARRALALEMMKGEAAMAAAGAAERMRAGASLDSAEVHIDGDLGAVERMAQVHEAFTGQPQREFVMEAITRAMKILTKDRDAWLAVARALYTLEDMTGDQVRAAVWVADGRPDLGDASLSPGATLPDGQERDGEGSEDTAGDSGDGTAGG